MEKCGHGSDLDEGHLGSINKDTSSSCFSPHYDLHFNAARLAEEVRKWYIYFWIRSNISLLQATFQYLEDIRKTVTNEVYQSMLSLSYGSALAIALDTSGSMSNEIDAVRNEISEIIDAANANGKGPSVYILAPYEASVDLKITKDTEEVEEFLGNLYADGGTEMVFTALQVWYC